MSSKYNNDIKRVENEIVKDKKNKIIIYIVVAFFLLFVAILELVFVSGAINNINIDRNANFEEVEATVIEYKEYEVYGHKVTVPIGTVYATYYEYRSPNGEIYSGCWQAKIKTEEEAKAQIGMKVTLYVDDELKLQAKSLDIDYTGIIIGLIFGCVCLFVSLGLFTYLLMQLLLWRKQMEKLKGLHSKNNEKRPPRNFSTLHFAILIFTIFLIVGIIGSAVSKEKEYSNYINANFVEVEAEIYEYKEFEKDNSIYYTTYYRYISESGKVYSGMWSNDILSKEDAELAVGDKVPLYYDTQLGAVKSVSDIEPVEKPEHLLDGIIVIVSVILFINSLVRFIRFIILNERYKKSTSHSLEDNYEQQI